MINTNFNSQNLVVDWISFYFPILEESEQNQLAQFFLKLGFNSFQLSGKTSQTNKESILASPNNKFQVSFVKEGPFWKGTILELSGVNARKFYRFIQTRKIPWKLFSSARLNRFDLYYSRDKKKDDPVSTKDFLQNCQRHLKQNNKKFSLQHNYKGFILKIGNRKSQNYFRIYDQEKSLKFEHEMKGQLLRRPQTLLVENQFDEFEQELSSNFLLSFGKLLPLNYSYTDWLVTQLRPIRKQTITPPILTTDYIQPEIIMDTRSFINLIQFINYAQHLDYEIEYLGGVAYRQVTFKLRDFLEFQDSNIKSTNNYRLTKLKDFFRELQAGLFVTCFSDTRFQSLVLVPQTDFYTCPQQKSLIGKVWLVEELFYYNFPFYFPNFFQQKLTKDQLEVQVYILQVFSSVNIEKKFLIQKFLDSYPAVLNGKRKTNIKKYFIESIRILEDSGLIQPKYKIISKGIDYQTDQLTTKNIHEGFVIYEHLDF